MRALALVTLLAVMLGCGSASSSTSSSSSSGASSTSAASSSGASCDSAVAHAATLCASDASRACFFHDYATLCQKGNAAAVAASTSCFTDACATFVEPGTAAVASCLAASYASFDSSAARAATTDFCARCPKSCTPSGDAITVPFQHLSAAGLKTLDDCLRIVTACEDAYACIASEVPGLIACP